MAYTAIENEQKSYKHLIAEKTAKSKTEFGLA
jgi:hypothetical protein